MMFWAVLLGTIAVTVGLDCTGQPNGIYEYTCFSYVSCYYGVATEIVCNTSDVFDPDQARCVTPSDGFWPCADVENCIHKEDQRYPDYINGCKTYYTCHKGFFLGHNFCPPSLVFDIKGQICNWYFNVVPPCGTCTDPDC
ncbi:uncharacterized protein [Haliotis asinina]|uniref:uncharacterized protein n=1 Tax=Haliotis asinina TaxID=109174 RepID=UPI003532628D